MAALMSPDRYLAFETRNNASRKPGQALVTVSRINKTCFKARKRNLVYHNKVINVSFIPFFVFGFWSLLATKLRKYYEIFVYILQGKMGKTEKNGKKIMQLK